MDPRRDRFTVREIKKYFSPHTALPASWRASCARMVGTLLIAEREPVVVAKPRKRRYVELAHSGDLQLMASAVAIWAFRVINWNRGRAMQMFERQIPQCLRYDSAFPSRY